MNELQSPWEIRHASPDDAPALSELKRRTFRQAFVDGPLAIPYSAENFDLFEAQNYSEEAVARELRDPAHMQWVVIAENDDFAGYAHVGPCKLPHENASPADGELYQLYISDDWQGQGMGKQLLDVALDWLTEHMPGPVWLGVFSGNARAQAVYTGRGFVKVGEYQFSVGDHRDHEYIMRRG